MHFGINQKRHIEAKCLDAPGDLLNLFFAVQPRVLRVRPQLADRQVSNRKKASCGRAAADRRPTLFREIGILRLLKKVDFRMQ